MQMWRTFVRTVLAKRKESGGLSKQFPNIHQTPALLIAGKPQIYGSFPEKELDITVAEFWTFFQKKSQSCWRWCMRCSLPLASPCGTM